MHFNPDYDTHSFIKKLTSKKFAEEQAEAIVDVVKEVLFASNLKVEKIEKEVDNATNTVHDTKEKLKEVVTTIEKDLALTQKEVTSVQKDISEINKKLDNINNNFATKDFVQSEIEKVRTEIEKVRTDVKNQYIKFTGLVFGLLFAFKIFTPYLDKFL